MAVLESPYSTQCDKNSSFGHLCVSGHRFVSGHLSNKVTATPIVQFAPKRPVHQLRSVDALGGFQGQLTILLIWGYKRWPIMPVAKGKKSLGNQYWRAVGKFQSHVATDWTTLDVERRLGQNQGSKPWHVADSICVHWSIENWNVYYTSETLRILQY